MDLNEAAFVWGRFVWNKDWNAHWDGRQNEREREAATTIIRELALDPTHDEFPCLTSDYIGIACAMYYRDVRCLR